MLLYSSLSWCEVNRRPDARYFTTCGFEAIRGGFVVCPSRYPSRPLIRTVSSGFPLSSRIRVLRRLIILCTYGSGERAILDLQRGYGFLLASLPIRHWL